MRNPLVWLSDKFLTITAIPLLLMMAHVTLDVLLKYFFNFAIQGTLEVTAYYYMVAIVVLPMAFIELTRQSIAVDLFFLMMPRRMRVVTALLVLLLSAAGYGGLAWISFPDAIKAFERKEIVMGAVSVYIWPARFLLPVSLILTAAICVMHAVRLIIDPRVRDEFCSAHVADAEMGVD